MVLLAAGLGAALWQARVAEHERVRAQQRFDQVRQLSKYVIYDLQDGLSKLAGSTELRRQMVERSLAYLDSLAGEASADPGLQMELAGAYARLGAVLGQPSVANLGDREGALKSYAKARDLLNGVVAADPRNGDARRSLGRVLLDLVNAHKERKLRTPILAEATNLWEALAREDPTNEENLRGLASAHFSGFTSSQFSEQHRTVAHMERALEIFQKLLEAKPEDTSRKRNVALCHKYLGSHFALRDPPRGLRHSLAAAELDSERLSAEPQNAQAKLDYTFSIGQVADFYAAPGQYEKALAERERVLVLRRELWAADRANVYARDRLAFALMQAAELQMISGRQRLAGPLLRESIEHARAVPANSQTPYILGKDYLYLGALAAAAGKDPCPSYRSMAEMLRQVPDETLKRGFILERVRELRDRACERLKSCADPAGSGMR